MDDKIFQEWTERLTHLREDRVNLIKKQMSEMGPKFSADSMFHLINESISKIIEEWWTLEERSWNETPPADADLALENSKAEFESLVEFEKDAINQEIQQFQQEFPLIESELEEGHKSFDRISGDLKANVTRRLEGLPKSQPQKAETSPNPGEKDRTPPPPPVPAARPLTNRTGGGSSGGSGFGIIIGFIVGLLLGSGVGLYFWDRGNRMEASLNSTVEALKKENRELLDQMTFVQETYFKLATGKMYNIPQLNEKVGPTRKTFKARRDALEKEFAQKRANLIKRIPAGDRLDRSLAKLDEAKAEAIASLQTQEQTALGPLFKQLQIHDELMKGESEPK